MGRRRDAGETAEGAGANDHRARTVDRLAEAAAAARRPSGAQKRRIRKRDGKRGRFYLTKRVLHVYHIVYRSEDGEREEPDSLTVCLQHHDVAHPRKRW